MGFHENDKITFTKPTDIHEIRALIDLFYLRRALNQNLYSVKDLVYHDSSCDVFNATMNYMRFYFLCQFDDKETNCTTLCIPSEYLAI